MSLRIVTFRDSDSAVLFEPAKKIEAFGKELKKLAKDMEKTLVENDALGLAAPQINKSLAVCAVKSGQEVHFFCNPGIVSRSKAKEKAEEGCLSFPNVFLEISRAKEVEVAYQNINGKHKKLKAEGILARVIQHEIDHLDGITFAERA